MSLKNKTIVLKWNTISDKRTFSCSWSHRNTRVDALCSPVWVTYKHWTIAFTQKKANWKFITSGYTNRWVSALNWVLLTIKRKRRELPDSSRRVNPFHQDPIHWYKRMHNRNIWFVFINHQIKSIKVQSIF